MPEIDNGQLPNKRPIESDTTAEGYSESMRPSIREDSTAILGTATTHSDNYVWLTKQQYPQQPHARCEDCGVPVKVKSFGDRWRYSRYCRSHSMQRNWAKRQGRTAPLDG